MFFSSFWRDQVWRESKIIICHKHFQTHLLFSALILCIVNVAPTCTFKVKLWTRTFTSYIIWRIIQMNVSNIWKIKPTPWMLLYWQPLYYIPIPVPGPLAYHNVADIDPILVKHRSIRILFCIAILILWC